MSEKVAKARRKTLRMTASPELSSHVIGAHNIDEVINGIAKREKDPTFLVVDLFCGAGGTSTGFEMTDGAALVIACVNHDPGAIKSHWINHPHVAHFEEDIRTLDLHPLARLLNHYRKLYPAARVILWASLECTNFSKAKGGQPREADSRTLADHLHRYVEALQPDFVQIENVVEFMSWGPLDENGKPVSKRNGQDYVRWCNEMKAHGYYDEWKELNSADFGAYTSRNRLFGCFARPGQPIVWPTPTHARNPEKASLFSSLKKWMPVKDVLDFSDEGNTIFRDKPLSEKTLARIYAGLVKYVAGMGQRDFIAKYYSGRPEGKVGSVEAPAATITTAGTQALVRAFLVQQNGIPGVNNPPFGIDRPSRTITTGGGNQYLVQPAFLSKAYGGSPEDKNISVEGPAGTVTTVDHHTLVQPFMIQNNGTNPESRAFSVDGPARTIMATHTTQQCIVRPEFIISSNGGIPSSKSRSVEEPGYTLTTQNNKALVLPCFLLKYNSTDKNGSHNPPSVEEPAPVVATQNRLGLVQPQFVMQYNGKSIGTGIGEPCNTIPTRDRFQIVQARFLNHYYSMGGQDSGIEQPSPTLTTKDRVSVITTSSLQSVEQPAGTIMTNDKHRLVHTVPFVLNPSHGGHSTSADAPCPVIVARQDKAPLYVVLAEQGAQVAVPVYEGDSEMTIKIKEFMALYGIVDIKMRMLKVPELLRIQGFPAGYVLSGTQSDQKKFIGNSVVPHVVRAWAEAMAARINEIDQSQKVA